jgi:hypothetical protein
MLEREPIAGSQKRRSSIGKNDGDQRHERSMQGGGNADLILADFQSDGQKSETLAEVRKMLMKIK